MNLEINPKYITSNDGIELVVLTKEEYNHMQELLEDLEDFRTLQEAKAQDNPNVRIPFEDVP